MEDMENKQAAPMANEIHQTPLGKCEWAHVLKAQTKFDSDGVYSIKLNLDTAGAEPIIELTRKAVLGFRQLEEQLGHSIVGYATPPWVIDEENGTYKFNFKQKAVGKPKNADPFPISIDVFDAKLNEWPKDVLIGNGSQVKVAFTLYAWNSAAQGGIGVTFQLKAVQVISHIPYEAESRDYGFQPEEGTDMGGKPFQAGTGKQNNEAGDNGDIPLDAPPKSTNPYEGYTGGPVKDNVPF